MTNSEIHRRARRAGLNVKKTRRGWVLGEVGHGDSLFFGQSSSRSWHSERRIKSFLTRHEKGGIG